MNNKRIFGAAALAACVALAHADTMDGKSLFAKNCAACHQPTGKGIPGAFPALAGNSFVQGAPSDVATVLLRAAAACRISPGASTTTRSPRC